MLFRNLCLGRRAVLQFKPCYTEVRPENCQYCFVSPGRNTLNMPPPHGSRARPSLVRRRRSDIIASHAGLIANLRVAYKWRDAESRLG